MNLDIRARLFAQKIAPLYVILNWRWNPIDRVPTVLDLYHQLKELLDGLGPETGMSSSTGGLEVRREEAGGISMSFVVDDWDFR